MESQDSLNTEMVLVLGTSGMLLLTTAIAVFIYLYQRKLIKRKLEFQKIEDLLKRQELKSAYAMLSGQEKAYKRIAEELHDNLGSILVTLNMFADTIQKKKDAKTQQDLAKRISETAALATETTRKISHSLQSGALKHFGLATAVQELTDALNEGQTISVNSTLQIRDQLDSEISLNTYRIIQELVNNTLKHARANRINIDLNQTKEHLTLIFEDNGVGFEMGESMKKGIGLRNLESRVERMEGQLTIDSRKNTGTTTIIDIPL